MELNSSLRGFEEDENYNQIGGYIDEVSRNDNCNGFAKNKWAVLTKIMLYFREDTEYNKGIKLTLFLQFINACAEANILKNERIKIVGDTIFNAGDSDEEQAHKLNNNTILNSKSWNNEFNLKLEEYSDQIADFTEECQRRVISELSVKE